MDNSMEKISNFMKRKKMIYLTYKGRLKIVPKKNNNILKIIRSDKPTSLKNQWLLIQPKIKKCKLETTTIIIGRFNFWNILKQSLSYQLFSYSGSTKFTSFWISNLSTFHNMKITLFHIASLLFPLSQWSDH